MGEANWFNKTKGYSFIVPSDGGQDLLGHIKAVEKAGYIGLAEGARVSYEPVTAAIRTSAKNLRLS